MAGLMRDPAVSRRFALKSWEIKPSAVATAGRRPAPRDQHRVDRAGSVTRRALLVAWVAVALVFLVLLAYELAQWRALSSEAMRAADERRRLTDEIRLREEQMAAELRARAPVLGEMRWTAGAADPGTFLTRLAELAGDKRVKVVAVGPLERQVTPQWEKSWHAIQVVAPYREIRELAARIEGERGILEDVRLEPAPAPLTPAGRPGAPSPVDEVHARFRMTALELSAPSKRLAERALGAGSAAPRSASSPPAPLGARPLHLRGGAVRPRPRRSPAPRVEAPLAPLALSAIVGFPGGHLAIVNNQVVKIGDVVSGHEVVAITDSAVSVREPGAPTRTLQLPELGAAPPAAPRR